MGRALIPAQQLRALLLDHGNERHADWLNGLRRELGQNAPGRCSGARLELQSR
jgi:hypothetical protein